MRKLATAAAFLILVGGQVAYAASSCSSGNTTVLQGIPAIAKVFAPLVGANWQNFAQDLAGICAVESGCNPNTKHVLQNGTWSAYQGLYQMSPAETTRAENYLNQVYPQLQQLAQSGQIPQDAWTFFQQAVQSGRSSSGDRRFLPAYGVILGAAKHIQIQKQLEAQYPGDPLRQAAGHMVAQFSGIAESQIAKSNFSAPITGTPGNANTEAGALSVNRVGGSTLASAIESAGAAYGTCMSAMMTQMSQVTGGLTNVPTSVAPFNAPPYQAGPIPNISVPYSGVSTLMEMGAIPATTAQVAPIQGNLPTLPASAPVYAPPAQTIPAQSIAPQPAVTTTPTPSVTPTVTPTATSTAGSCSPQYYCSNNTVYYRSSSCATNVFQMCQFGCSGTVCAPGSSSSSSPPTTPGATLVNLLGPVGIATGATSSSFGSTSPFLNSSVYTIFQGQAQQQSGATGTAYLYPGQNSASGGTTLTLNNSSQTYTVSAYAFSGILNQLKSVLNGLFSYLGSL